MGLFVPPGFRDIKYKLFITFGVLCVGAAVQVFFTYTSPTLVAISYALKLTSKLFSYPETCGKTIEEVEEMFSKGGPKPWHTKPGQSKLDTLIEEAREKNLHVGDVMDDEKPEEVAAVTTTTAEKAA